MWKAEASYEKACGRRRRSLHLVGKSTACRLLRVSRRTLQLLLDAGEVRAYRLGRMLCYRHSDLEAYLERARVQFGDLRYQYAGDDAHTEEGRVRCRPLTYAAAASVSES